MLQKTLRAPRKVLHSCIQVALVEGNLTLIARQVSAAVGFLGLPTIYAQTHWQGIVLWSADYGKMQDCPYLSTLELLNALYYYAEHQPQRSFSSTSDN